MKNSAALRLAVIIGLVVTLIVIGKFTEIGEWFDLENIISSIKETGYWGLLMFATLFVIGSFIQIPAMLFVLAAIITYGQIEGTIVGYLGVVLAMIVNFLVIKTLGGKLLHEIRNKRVQQLLLKMDARPVSTIIVLRLILWAAPVLNYTLAMTGVKSKDYIIGSTIGVIVPVMVFSILVYFLSEVIVPLVV